MVLTMENNETNNTQENTNEQTHEFNLEEAFAKFESSFNGRLENYQKTLEKNIADSIAKKYGGSEEDSQKIIDKMREKQEQAPDYEKIIDGLREENQKYKDTIYQYGFDQSFQRISKDLDLKEDKADYIKRLADFSNINDKDGNLREDLMRKALEQVATDFPELKNETKEEKPLDIRFNSGTKNNENHGDIVEEVLKKIM